MIGPGVWNLNKHSGVIGTQNPFLLRPSWWTCATWSESSTEIKDLMNWTVVRFTWWRLKHPSGDRGPSKSGLNRTDPCLTTQWEQDNRSGKLWASSSKGEQGWCKQATLLIWVWVNLNKFVFLVADSQQDAESMSKSRKGIEDNLVEEYRNCQYYKQTKDELGGFKRN